MQSMFHLIVSCSVTLYSISPTLFSPHSHVHQHLLPFTPMQYLRRSLLAPG